MYTFALKFKKLLHLNILPKKKNKHIEPFEERLSKQTKS